MSKKLLKSLLDCQKGHYCDTYNFSYYFLNKKDVIRFRSLRLSILFDLENFLLDCYVEVFHDAYKLNLVDSVDLLQNQHFIRKNIKNDDFKLERNLFICLETSIFILKKSKNKKRLLSKLLDFQNRVFLLPQPFFSLSKYLIKSK